MLSFEEFKHLKAQKESINPQKHKHKHKQTAILRNSSIVNKTTLAFSNKLCDSVINNQEQPAFHGNYDASRHDSVVNSLRSKADWQNEATKLSETFENNAVNRRSRFEAATNLLNMVDAEGSKELLERLDKGQKVSELLTTSSMVFSGSLRSQLASLACAATVEDPRQV